jgi:multiple antibiotic resistance protein
MLGVLLGVLSTALVAFFQLFPIMNPPAMAPVFQEITQGLTDSERNVVAFKISLYAFYLLTLILLVGGWLLKILGVSIEMVGIAGGILLFHTAWGMLNTDDRLTHTEKEEIKFMSGKIFFPLTLPMTAGPGSIAVTLAMIPKGHFLALASILQIIGLCIGIGMAAATVWVFYSLSGAFLSRLGNTAKATIGQISAFILLAIGVQFVWKNLSVLIKHL